MAQRAVLRRPRATILIVGLLALAVAEAAALLLAPGGGQPAPVEVDPAAYFDSGRIERAADYADTQRLLFLLRLGLELAILGLLALRPGPLIRLGRRLGRPLLAAALAGISISLLLTLAATAPALIAHERAVDFGISTQSLGSWLWDRSRSAAIAAFYAAAGAVALVALQRRARRWWWAWGAGVIAGFAVITTFLAPVVIAPLFNDFERLPPGQVRADVEQLADRAGVELGGVYEVDASRRGNSFNAYVAGFGSTRRIVLYDNLLEGTERSARRSVVAHELAHAANADIARGLTFVAIVAPLGMLFVALAGGRLARSRGAEPGTPAAIPAYALVLSLAALAINVPGNQLSRAVEREADRFAIELTDDPEGLIELQQRIAEANLSQPEPPAWSRVLFGTHPSKLERIGLAEAYRRAPG